MAAARWAQSLYPNYGNVRFRWPDKMLEDYYKEPRDGINLLFIGSSHSMCSYDPAVFDAAPSVRSFNMGSSAQAPDTSYYLLKQAFSDHDIKLVVFDMYYFFMQGDYNYNQANLIFRPMRTSPARVEMFFANFSGEERRKLIISWLNPYYPIKNMLTFAARERLGLSERVEEDATFVYKSKGYLTFRDIAFNPEAFKKEYAAKPESFDGLSKRQLGYIRRIAALAKKNDAELLFVNTPTSPTYRKLLNFYPRIHDELAALSDELGVRYIDYNYDPNFIRTGVTDADFADRHHLGPSGSQKYSRFFLSELRNMGYLDEFK